jgi:trimeric autotransporter adhesin
MKNSNHIFTTILLALGFLALSSTPNSFGVVPAPDGGYPNFTTAEGQNALKNLTTGSGNTGVGWFSLFSDTTANFNTAVGVGTLALNTADNNTAIGAVALFLNKTGTNNTAVGMAALLNNDTGGQNTAIGQDALNSNTTGSSNTATGQGALTNNIDADGNTANGDFALHDNMHGNDNTAIGQQALAVNQADDNTATGFQALFSNFGGENNTANGAFALSSNDSGQDNTAVGNSALFANIDGFTNTAIGRDALVQNDHGNDNTAVGAEAGTSVRSGSGNVFIGAGMTGFGTAETDHTYIRNINTTSVSGVGSDFVTVNLATGLLGHATSSRRYKEEIRPMNDASQALYRLKPVTYRYKKEIDQTQSPAFGLIAEEVAEVNPDLVARNAEGQPESVHYEMVNAMLLNEFLKEHKKVEDQQATIAELKSTVAQQQKGMEVLTAQPKEQAAQVQKVSAQVEMSKPAPQVVVNKP